MMVKPSFFIIGAPKCGTTSLFHWLTQHPQVFIPDRKEIHYFNFDGMTRIKTLSEYESLFLGCGGENMVAGDASTHYLYSMCAVENILSYNPSAKFIVCVRNPVEMAPSLHSERISQGMDGMADFERAWRESERRPKTLYKAAESKRDPDRLNYKAYCMLGKQVARLFSLVKRENVLVVIFDDLISNPEKVYFDILDFIGVARVKVDYMAVNKNKKVRSVLLQTWIARLVEIKRKISMPSLRILRFISRLNKKVEPRASISSQLEKEIKKYYYDDIVLLSKLVGRDLTFWVR